jgi:hypothetical protein
MPFIWPCPLNFLVEFQTRDPVVALISRLQRGSQKKKLSAHFMSRAPVCVKNIMTATSWVENLDSTYWMFQRLVSNCCPPPPAPCLCRRRCGTTQMKPLFIISTARSLVNYNAGFGINFILYLISRHNLISVHPWRVILETTIYKLYLHYYSVHTALA